MATVPLWLPAGTHKGRSGKHKGAVKSVLMSTGLVPSVPRATDPLCLPAGTHKGRSGKHKGAVQSVLRFTGPLCVPDEASPPPSSNGRELSIKQCHSFAPLHCHQQQQQLCSIRQWQFGDTVVGPL